MGNILMSQSTNMKNNLNIALRATNTIHQQLTDKIVKTSKNSSGIHKLKCKTCNNSYVGQSGWTIEKDIKNTHDT
jgi:transposase-like protein